ncbi:50S ribosomal protein L13 [Blochmannia endosymbiont of Camponotus sp. C-003]|uniref:50S ribosomal protein L13 n=1 Tax=unclassified Candidatus Blochmanniella TaxID=711328 RepID=UPI0020245008|nr:MULTISPECIES: 50S ribosomal protein L13 [unclassified Candidatus Blochmannia]URJ23179.1 50S ribosomal protein L13 [Blochmannia endosymbiont of Camponotus sp. C-003]URJ28648.1 50S ribosomal protein L13 [Blochmannia endosymbiont of Camponotus sp. C-046]
MKTFMAKSHLIRRKWHIIDAKNKILGRLSTVITRYLIGKHKIEYTPHIDTGDYVIVVNAKEVSVSGHKRDDKIYYHHTGYIGGIKQLNFKGMINRYPEKIIEISVKGMLPKGPLGRMMYSRLRVYSGNAHVHAAQEPQFIDC